MTATPQARRSVFRAVIEEARNRARRRRTRYALLAVLVLAVAAGAYFSTHRGGAGAGGPAARALQRIDIVPSATPRTNGALTIMDVQANAKHEGPAGWYSISTVDKLGRLHRLARCSTQVRWCGEVESIDWSPDGRSLAFAVTSLSMKNPFNGVHVLNLRTGRDVQILKAGQYGGKRLGVARLVAGRKAARLHGKRRNRGHQRGRIGAQAASACERTVRSVAFVVSGRCLDRVRVEWAAGVPRDLGDAGRRFSTQAARSLRSDTCLVS